MKIPGRHLPGFALLALAAFLPAFGAAETVSPAPTVDFAAALRRAAADVEAARRELDRTYERVRAEKQQAVGEVETRRRQARELEEKYEQAATDLENLAARIRTLRRENEQLGKMEKQLRAIALDYRRAFEAGLAAIDADRLASRLDAFDRHLDAQPETLPPEALAELLETAVGHMADSIGGSRGTGAAVDLAGVRHEGAFVRFGPLVYFRGAAGVPTGLAVQRLGSVLPTVFQDFGASSHAGIEALFDTGAGVVPVDATMGAAVQLRRAEESWFEHLRRGGIVMIPLLGLALACVTIALAKTGTILTLATARSQETVLRIVEALRADDVDRAMALAKNLRRPLGPVIREGIEHRHAVREHLEEILYEKILTQVPDLERFLGGLAVCASAAPLLGLLGTVTGMIHTFRLITVFGTGDARLLSSGISEALITTEVGLTIAIPALLAHALLSRRLRRAVALARETAVIFVNGLKIKRESNG